MWSIAIINLQDSFPPLPATPRVTLPLVVAQLRFFPPRFSLSCWTSRKQNPPLCSAAAFGAVTDSATLQIPQPNWVSLGFYLQNTPSEFQGEWNMYLYFLLNQEYKTWLKHSCFKLPLVMSVTWWNIWLEHVTSPNIQYKPKCPTQTYPVSEWCWSLSSRKFRKKGMISIHTHQDGDQVAK